jgi:uncharacterized protein (UPF0332 family)
MHMLADDRFRIGTLLEKADESLGAAETMIEKEHYEEALLRCYHAVFFVLRAFLMKNRVPVQRTSESVAVFKRVFVDTGRLPKLYHEDLVLILQVTDVGRADSRAAPSKGVALDTLERASRLCGCLIDRME